MDFDALEEIVGSVTDIYPTQPVHARTHTRRCIPVLEVDVSKNVAWHFGINIEPTEPDLRDQYTMYKISNYRLEIQTIASQLTTQGHFIITYQRDPSIAWASASGPQKYDATLRTGGVIRPWYKDVSFEPDLQGWRFCKKAGDPRLYDYGKIQISTYRFPVTCKVAVFEHFDTEYSVPTVTSSYVSHTSYALQTIAYPDARTPFAKACEFIVTIIPTSQEIEIFFALPVKSGIVPAGFGRATFAKTIKLNFYFDATPIEGEPYQVNYTYNLPFADYSCISGATMWGSTVSKLNFSTTINPYGTLGTDLLEFVSVAWDDRPDIEQFEALDLQAQLVFHSAIEIKQDIKESENRGIGSAYESLS